MKRYIVEIVLAVLIVWALIAGIDRARAQDLTQIMQADGPRALRGGFFQGGRIDMWRVDWQDSRCIVAQSGVNGLAISCEWDARPIYNPETGQRERP